MENVTECYVTLRPHSMSNATDDNLVVEYHDWLDYVNNKQPSYEVLSRHALASDAIKEAGRRNGEALGKVVTEELAGLDAKA